MILRRYRRPALPAPQRGFTITELLVVVALLASLLALLLPALQTFREAGRRLQCGNHIRQLAAACLQHESKQGWLPSGGWAWTWAGEPDRGFDSGQPGGWTYNILPYLELQSLRQVGAGGNTAQAIQRARTPIPFFHCPSRRPARAYPTWSYYYNNSQLMGNAADVNAKSDYAANGGTVFAGGDECSATGPSSLAQASTWTETSWRGNCPNGYVNQSTGVVYRRSMCRIAQIRDGASCTYLLGEKSVNPDWYAAIGDWGDDGARESGYDFNHSRWAASAPLQDRPGLSNYFVFGSAHPAGVLMAFCDGSVRRVGFEIDATTHSSLGTRAGGIAVDPANLDP